VTQVLARPRHPLQPEIPHQQRAGHAEEAAARFWLPWQCSSASAMRLLSSASGGESDLDGTKRTVAGSARHGELDQCGVLVVA
jgi:hypothetical protein